MRLVRLVTKTSTMIGRVIRIIALEPLGVTLAFEGKYVRGDPIEKPAIVRNDQHASGKLQKCLLKGAKRFDIEIVGWFV